MLNLCASYDQEAEEIVARLTNDLGTNRIGVLYQDDSFGRAGYRGLRTALERRGLEPVAIGLYARNTIAVKTALLDLLFGVNYFCRSRVASSEDVTRPASRRPYRWCSRWERRVPDGEVILSPCRPGIGGRVRRSGRQGCHPREVGAERSDAP